MQIDIKEGSLVLMMGPSGSGKTTFAKACFDEDDIISSDDFRIILSGDVAEQKDNSFVFDTIYKIIDHRLSNGLLTVMDATNLDMESRDTLKRIADRNNCETYVIALKLSKEQLYKNRKYWVPEHVVEKHYKKFERSLNYIKKDFRDHYYIIENPKIVTGMFSNRIKVDEEYVNINLIVPSPIVHIKESERYCIVGDVHGCYDELLKVIDYLSDKCDKFIFLGDLVDRGPKSMDVLLKVMNLVDNGKAYCVMGNHDNKFYRAIKGNKVQINDTLAKTLEEYDKLTEYQKDRIKDFLSKLPYHLLLDEGNLVVSHAGIKENMIGKESKFVNDFCLYGDVNGDTDEDGFPIRREWFVNYRGKALNVYGHTPHKKSYKVNNTINIDTGAVFGNKLTALLYPSLELYSIGCKKYDTTHRKIREFDSSISYIPDIKDFTKDQRFDIEFPGRDGKPINFKSIYAPADKLLAASNELSRYSVDSRYLVYIPPTMSPCETSENPNYLEYPTEAFDYYKSKGLNSVICEKKHMGSRAVIVICKNEEVAADRFHVKDGSIGAIYTRKGNKFFLDKNKEVEILDRLNNQITNTGLYEKLDTEIIVLDCEIMPWSDKARGLISKEYAPIGMVGKSNLAHARDYFDMYYNRTKDDNASKLSNLYSNRLDDVNRYIDSYHHYCHTVESVDDIKVAPFHILATEYKLLPIYSHLEQLSVIHDYITDNKNFIDTDYNIVYLDDEESIKKGINWWEELTDNGFEGMVVKPTNFHITDTYQPAIKCRGKEYLRIIYGPEYTKDIHMLKKRSLSTKRKLAINEFLLGMHSLYNFTKKNDVDRFRSVLCTLIDETTYTDPRL